MRGTAGTLHACDVLWSDASKVWRAGIVHVRLGPRRGGGPSCLGPPPAHGCLHAGEGAGVVSREGAGERGDRGHGSAAGQAERSSGTLALQGGGAGTAGGCYMANQAMPHTLRRRVTPAQHQHNRHHTLCTNHTLTHTHITALTHRRPHAHLRLDEEEGLVAQHVDELLVKLVLGVPWGATGGRGGGVR